MRLPPARLARPARRFVCLAGLLGVAIFACIDNPDPLGPDRPAGPVALKFSARYVGVADPEDPPINHIRIRAVEEGSARELRLISQDLDPAATEWQQEIKFDLPGGRGIAILVSVELLHKDPALGESGEWSALSNQIRMFPGDVKEIELIFYRGPLANLTITRLRINRPIPIITEGDTLPLSATVEGASGRPRLFWRSLDTATATVSRNTGAVTAKLPGSARVVVAAGPRADTAVVQVRQKIVRIAVSPDTGRASSLGQEVTFTARAFDPRGAEVGDVAFTWAAPDSAVAASTGGGRFVARGNGRAQVQATVDREPGVVGRSLLLVEQRLARIEVSPATHTFTALGQTQQMTATARDALGSAIPGKSFAWSSSDPGVVDVSTAGLATAAAQGTATIQASSEGLTGAASLAVEQRPASLAVAPAALSFSSLGATSQLTATVRDANGHVAPGAAVSWSSANPAIATVSATGLVTAVANGATAVTASSGSASASASITVAQAASRLEKASGDSQSATVGTTLGAEPTVRVTDTNGYAVAGVSVSWAVASGGGSVASATSQTDASGLASTGWVLGTAAGAQTLTASVQGVGSVTFSATALAGAAATVEKVAGDGQTAIVATAVAVAPKVRVLDSNGNPVTGATVTFAVASGGGSVTGATQATGNDGTAAVGSWTLGTTVGTNTLIASASGASSVTFSATGTPGAASAATSTVGVNPSTIGADGTSTATITVQLKDAYGNNLTSSGGTVTVASTLGTVSAVTDNGNGSYTATLTAGTTGGTARVTAGLDGANLASEATVTFTPATTTRLVVSGPGSVSAGWSATVTITAADPGGNAVTSYAGTKSITFSGASSAGSYTPAAETSTGTPVSFGNPTSLVFTNGVATTRLWLYKAETAVIAATDGTLSATGSDRLTITVLPANLASFSLTLNASQTNGVSFTGTNTLTALDGYGNTVTTFDAAVEIVTITTSLSGTVSGLGSAGNAVLNRSSDFSSGVADLTGKLTYTGNVGTGTFTATTANGQFGASGNVTVQAGAANRVTLSGPASVTAGSVSSALTLTAKDVSHNVSTVSQTTVFNLSTSSTGSAAFYSDAGGTVAITQVTIAAGSSSATFYYKDLLAGSATLTASLASGMSIGNASYQLTVNPGSATQVTLRGPTSVTAGSVTTALTITAKDASGNPGAVTSATTFNLSSNSTGTTTFYSDGAGTTAISQATMAAGDSTATLYYKDLKAGTPTVTVTRVSGMSVGSATVQFTVSAGSFTKLQILLPGETAAAGTSTGKTGSPSSIIAGTAMTATVNAVDANWNLVNTVTDVVAITSSDGAATLPASANLVAGTKNFSVTLQTAGSQSVTASDVTD
ncbi:MAG: Ig-like domain-containing protein, partial [Gemmatimonadetes bacterium]|nr:Ig-like domain-containing protein [Gemmatimonadota bacterium]